MATFNHSPIKLVFTLLIAGCLCQWQAVAAEDDWSQFRGPGGRSTSSTMLPIKFGPDSNIAWKSDLPAKGASSPIVVGDRVFVTCSGGDKQERLYTVCLDAFSGKTLWTQEFWATGRTLCHPLSANAAPSPASDGKHIIAFYSSNDLACMDLDGNLIWYRALGLDFPKIGNDTGMSASPAIHDGVVVVQIEGQGDSFAMGLDAKTGKTLWKQDRDRQAAWTSPVVINKPGGRSLVAVQNSNRLSIIDLQSGEVVSDINGTGSSIPSPLVEGEYLIAPQNGTTVYSVSGTGEAKQLWNAPQIRASTSSAVVHQNQIYTLSRAAVLNRFDMNEQGKPSGKIRVGGQYWATPVIAGNHMYLFTKDGAAKVIELSEKMKIVHETEFEDEVFLGTPAISKDGLYVRSDNSIWKFSTHK